MNISVIICTHNPHPDYLGRTLEALKAQTLPKEQWELLLVDNASKTPLAGVWDLSWHAHARHIREDELGLTPARLRGIRESRGGILIFVDDDNLLHPDYLKNAAAIAEEFPKLGAWGGEILPEFEHPPSPETEGVLGCLCIRKLAGDYWGNCRRADKMPFGAGMCIKKTVAENYAQIISGSAARHNLGRKGGSLSSWEDIDMALCAIDLGLGTGLFRSLQITHIIPARRLAPSYLLKIAEDMQSSRVVFFHLRRLDSIGGSRMDRIMENFMWWYRWLRVGRFAKQFLLAERRGIQRGKRAVAEMNS